MVNKEGAKKRKLSWYKAPIRLLIKIRDFYVHSITECSGHFEYGIGAAMACPTSQITTLPKSFSTNSTKSSSKEDYSELIRVASTRSVGNRTQLDSLQKQKVTKSPLAGPDDMPRSRSVGIGRIDEDKPCEFEEEIKVNTDVYPRSRSYAVTRRSRAF